MFKTINKIIKLKNTMKLMFMSLVFFVGDVLAKMPELEDPTQGKQKGLIPTLQAYMYDGAVVGGLIIVAGGFIVAAKSVLMEYNNIGEGKGSWGKFGTLVVIGIVLVVACIWLASLAAETLLN